MNNLIILCSITDPYSKELKMSKIFRVKKTSISGKRSEWQTIVGHQRKLSSASELEDSTLKLNPNFILWARSPTAKRRSGKYTFNCLMFNLIVWSMLGTGTGDLLNRLAWSESCRRAPVADQRLESLLFVPSRSDLSNLGAAARRAFLQLTDIRMLIILISFPFGRKLNTNWLGSSVYRIYFAALRVRSSRFIFRE